MVDFSHLSIDKMSIRFVLAILCVSLVIFGPSEARKKSKKEPLQFVQLEYAKALSENHKVNATVLHVRATGGKGVVSYTILEPNMPFEVDQRGHVWLMKKLDADKKKIYQLTIKAASTQNPDKPAFAKVRFDVVNMTKHLRFDVMNMKNHAPQFDNSDEKYICAVSENSRKAEILPPIRVIDQEKGDAGKLKRIEVVEQGIPFKFNVNKDGGVEMSATKDLDAEKESMYFFTIVAVDGSEKKSKPMSMFCKVVDVNEFAPEFDSDLYLGEVKRGKTYTNIVQVHATDKDIGEEFGNICKYKIITKDVPFKLSDSGILRLDKPLDKDAPNHCTFQVAALDCSGKSSTKYANITVYIKDDCKIAFKKPDFEEIIIPQCIGAAKISPDIGIIPNKQCEQKTDFSFSATFQLESKAGLGCDRQKYEASSLYKLCGSSDFIDILPKPSKSKKWTSKLQKDGDAFMFDGKTTVAAVPAEVIPERFGEHFTVSTWIQAGKHKGKQVIMAHTDKQSRNRIHFALIKNGKRFIVVHRLEPGKGSDDDYCNSDFHYTLDIFDEKWHHLTVLVDGCSVKLYVDGEHCGADTVDSNYRMHKSKNGAGLFIGAHWLGRKRAFTQHFRGKLSGLAINMRKPASQQTIRCMIGCREHINIDTSLPKGFRSELVGFNKMKIHGVGSAKDFEYILKNIEYQNELFTPTEGSRKIHVSITEKTTNFNKEFTETVELDRNDKPVITVEGCKEVKVTKRRLRDIGVPVCSKLKINYHGCKPKMNTPVNTVKLLDRAVVKVTPPFKKGESLKFPMQEGSRKSILEDLELESYHDNNGVIVSGVANYMTYEQILREIIYENINPKDKTHHTFQILVSEQNGRYTSDIEKLNVTILNQKHPQQKKYYKLKLAKRLHPFNLQETLKAEELPGAVSHMEKVASKGTPSGVLAAIIVCSVSVLAFLIVLGIYRLKKKSTVLEVEATAAEKEEMYWDDTGLGGVRITVNPLQKFQELDLNEDKDSEENSEDEENQDAKQSLEWDEGAL